MRWSSPVETALPSLYFQVRRHAFCNPVHFLCNGFDFERLTIANYGGVQ